MVERPSPRTLYIDEQSMNGEQGRLLMIGSEVLISHTPLQNLVASTWMALMMLMVLRSIENFYCAPEIFMCIGGARSGFSLKIQLTSFS